VNHAARRASSCARAPRHRSARFHLGRNLLHERGPDCPTSVGPSDRQPTEPRAGRRLKVQDQTQLAARGGQTLAVEDARKRLPGEQRGKVGLAFLFVGATRRPSSRRRKSDPNWIAQTARLLDTQAIHLSTLDVLDQVPASWSLSLVSSFLERSFRRDLSARNDTQLLKAIALGENLKVGESVWEAQRRLGGTLAEEVAAEKADGEAEVELSGEKLVEKDHGGDNDDDVVELDLDAADARHRDDNPRRR
jgi:hypothetical protein